MIQKFFATGLIFLSTVIIWTCSSKKNTEPDTLNPMLPKVLSSTPADGDTGMALTTAIVLVFDMAMNPASVESSFESNPAITGNFAWADSNRQVTWTSAAPLTASTQYTITLKNTAQSAKNDTLASNYIFTFTTTGTVGGTLPVVTSTTPSDLAIGVLKTTAISLSFNIAMDTATVRTALSSSPAITGSITWNGTSTTLTWTPDSSLQGNTKYSVTLSTSAKSTLGLALASTFSFSFTTETVVVVPRVISTLPKDSAVSVALTSDIIFTTNTPMDTASVDSSLFANPSFSGSILWLDSNDKFIWNPSQDMAPNTLYTLTLAKSAKSVAGVHMAANYSFKFTTTTGTGTEPRVSSTSPANGATLVSINGTISITFTQAMNTSSVESAISSNPGITGSYTWDAGDTKATWTPGISLLENTKYTVTISTMALSKLGDSLKSPYSFSFTTSKNPYTTSISGSVYDKETIKGIPGANVVLFAANSNSSLMRTVSDSVGRYEFRPDSGNYYVTVSAQGYIPSPPPGGRFTPFRLDLNLSFWRDFNLRKDSSGIITGSLTGKIEIEGNGNPTGILVIAIAADSSSLSTTTGPDGIFVFNNLPVGTYTLVAYRSGLTGDSVVIQATVIANTLVTTSNIKLTSDPGRILTGKVNFLAVSNGTADITLVDPITRTAIPGLSTKNDNGLNYILRGIPPGEYIAWGSYKNDGFVMDPDAIRKFGLPRVTYLPTDSVKNLSFDFTNAISIVRPTNHPDSLYPARLLTLQPYFVWQKYSSAKEYILVIFDSKGNRIWGGWDAQFNVLHTPILRSGVGIDSVQFNFDSTAVEPLRNQELYSWKVYADFDNAPGVQQLISSSEDLMGLFGNIEGKQKK